MADQSPQTPPNEPVQTGGEEQTPPAATPPEQVQGAATDDDEVISLPKKDYNELISQRDKNHERARVTENYVIEQMQKDDIKDFLSQDENKKLYPDVLVDDLMSATRPQEFAEIAKQTQARIDKAVQDRLGDIEKATTPILSPEERAAKLKKLKANPGASSLEQAIEHELAG